MNAVYTLICAEKADPKSQFTVELMCLVLDVSTSAFYAWDKARRTGASSARAARRALLAVHVRAAFEAGRGAYGVRRVSAMLSRSDVASVASASPKLVRSVMAELGLYACQPRAYRRTTIPDPAAGHGPADLLERDFTAAAPGTKLVGDITYLHVGAEGWLYLATVIDCHTKGVVGYSMAAHMRTDLIIDALAMAARNTTLMPGAIFHSDRGTQGGFKWSSQHLDGGELGWVVVRCSGRTWRGASRCDHRGVRRRPEGCSGLSGG